MGKEKEKDLGTQVPELCRMWPGEPLSGGLRGARCLVPRAWPAGSTPCQPRPPSSAERKVGILLSKRCAPRCPNTNMAYEWLSEPWLVRRIQRQCCNVSFCNAAPPTPRRPWARPDPLLLLLLGLLLLLLASQ